MTLNIQDHIPAKTQALPDFSAILYGQSKIGKSEIASRFPFPLFFDLEDGLKWITGPRVKDIETPSDLLKAIQELRASLRAGRLTYQTFILDGLTTFVTSASHKNKSKDGRKVAKAIVEDLVPVLEEFYALPGIRLITLHSRSGQYEKKIQTEHGERTINVTTEEPDVSPRLRTYLCGVADATGYCHLVGNEPSVEWLATDLPETKIYAGNRLGLPRRMKLNYDALFKLLTAPAAAPKPERPAASKTETAPPTPEKTTPTAPLAASASASDQPPVTYPPAASAAKSQPQQPITKPKDITADDLAKLMMPSEAILLLQNGNGPTLFRQVFERFKIDRSTANDIAKEARGNWEKALKGLDQHYVP